MIFYHIYKFHKAKLFMFKLLALVTCIVFVNTISSAEEHKPPLCIPVEHFGKPMKVTMVVYDYVVSYNWDDAKDAFCAAYKNQVGSTFLQENIPREQTLDNWKEMLSLQAFQNRLISNKDFLDLQFKK